LFHLLQIIKYLDPPIQILYLNIRHLLHDLATHVKPHESPATPRSTLTSSLGVSQHHSKEHHNHQTVEDLLSHLPPSSKSAFLSYTYLLPWGVDEEMDQTFKTKLLLQAPGFEATYAIKGFVLYLYESYNNYLGTAATFL
jgi:hypothetical protein